MAEDGDLREEYAREDLGDGVRGKFYDDYVACSNVVVLDPDVAEAFPNAKTVNDALRKLISKP